MARQLWHGRLAGAALYPLAIVPVGAVQRDVRHTRRPRACTATVRRARGVGDPAGRALHPAGDRGRDGPAGGVWPGRLGQSGPWTVWPAALVDLRADGRRAGPCVFQHAAGDPADPAGLALHPGRAIPPCRAVGPAPVRHLSHAGMARIAAGGAGGVRADLCHLPDELCGRADAGGRATGNDDRAGDLSGLSL